MERLNSIETIQLKSNSKITELWNVSKNTKLKRLEIINCNKITDFSCLENTYIEELTLLGCNYLSSFTSKLHINNFEFLLNIPKLNSLWVDVVKDKHSEYYLEILSQMSQLEELIIPNTFFTFNQFAWLSGKLPNVVNGLECFDYSEENCSYSIIGKNTPKYLKNRQRAEDY